MWNVIERAFGAVVGRIPLETRIDRSMEAVERDEQAEGESFIDDVLLRAHGIPVADGPRLSPRPVDDK